MHRVLVTDVDQPVSSEADKAADQVCWTTFVTTILLFLGFFIFIVVTSWETPPGGVVRVQSFEYFILCLLGGILSGLPHFVLTPMDLVKCRIQVGEYGNMSEGFRSIYSEATTQRGSVVRVVQMMYRGWGPTLIGYSIQGAMKFGMYEFFKFFYAVYLFAPGSAQDWRLYLMASASAELIADVGLAPWEAIKVKIQTTRLFPPIMGIVAPRMWATEGIYAFFKGLVPLWCRQVPYTMVKFSSFEKIVTLLYLVVLQTPKTAVSKPGQLLVSLVAGCLAGALCAIVSHPADTVVSKLNQRSDTQKTGGVSALIRELGCRGLWKGIYFRIVFIGCLTAMQWLIYDSFKVAVGLPTTGAAGGHATSHPHLMLITSAPVNLENQ